MQLDEKLMNNWWIIDEKMMKNDEKWWKIKI
jgi:hypothetical protein